MTTAPYLDQAHRALPQVLSLFDANPISSTFGLGDRYHWAWKGIDFANGSFQGSVHGLACLLAYEMLPKTLSPEWVLERIQQIIHATRGITRKNGSLDEILPYESSYCVTALVAYDILTALELTGERLSEEERTTHLATVKPLIQFLRKSTESHGAITNHLAVAAAALAHWQKMVGEDISKECDHLVDRITGNYSEEGWFTEYGGADPGYQTLALDYLVDLHRIAPHYELMDKLVRVIDFLCYAAHPDGSFGGTYGSRNTRFIYPAGIEALAGTTSNSIALARFTRRACEEQMVISLEAMDSPNLIPMFNSMCRAATFAKKLPLESALLPHAREDFQRQFPQAGLIMSKSSDDYSVLNWRKGGAFYSSHSGASGGILARDASGAFFTSQTADNESILVACDINEIVVDAPLRNYRMSYPSPLNMVILRLICISMMRVRLVNHLVKRILVWLLIHRRPKAVGRCRRRVQLSPFTVTDEWLDNHYQLELENPTDFYAIHMASQGYWQNGDST